MFALILIRLFIVLGVILCSIFSESAHRYLPIHSIRLCTLNSTKLISFYGCFPIKALKCRTLNVRSDETKY